MKNKLLILLCTMNMATLFAQHLEVDLNGGLSNPISSFSQDTAFANQGSSFGGSVNYLWKNIGVGLDLGSFQNEIGPNLLEYQNSFSFPTQSSIPNTFWKTKYATFGPVFQLGSEKLKFQLSPKMGLAQIQLPEYSVSYFSSLLNQELNVLSSTNNTKSIQNVLTDLGVKIKWNLTPFLGVNLKANYLTTRFFNAEKLTYTFKELTDLDGDGLLMEEEIIESPNFQKEICSPLSTLNTSIGLTLALGKKKKGKKENKSPKVKQPWQSAETPEKKSSICLEVELISPLYEDFNPRYDEAPTFYWSLNTTEEVKVRFELFELAAAEGEEISRKKIVGIETTEYSNPWPKSAPWPKEGKKSRTYQWQVTILPSATQKICNPFASATFMLIPGEVDVDILARTIVCRSPEAYDATGQVCFDVAETWEVTNGLNNAIQMSSYNLSQGIFSTQNPLPSTVFLPVSANTTQIFNYNYEICTSISTTQCRSRLAYQDPADPFSEAAASKLDSLPVCLCDICEEWDIKINNKQVAPWMHSTAKQDFIYIQDALTAIPPAGHNIVQVNAEIIDFRHYNSKIEDCKTCNKENTQYGAFIPYRNAANQDITNILAPPNITNQGQARYTRASGAPSGGAATLGLPPSREAIWKTTGPAGTTINNRQVDLTIGVPRFSELVDCCSDDIKICIRYTFTALNEYEECIKCSEVICYKVRRDATTVVPKSDPQPNY